MITPGGIHYRRDGLGDGPVVLLLHALGANLALWSAQVPALADGFLVVRADIRGHGGSASASSLTLGDLVADALEVLDDAGAGTAHVVGAALGATVALQLAADHPDRVGRLVLANASARAGTPQAWERRAALARTQGMGAVADLVLPRYFTPAYADEHPEDVGRVRAMLGGADPAGYAACCLVLRDADQHDVAPLVAAPTLIVTATHDVLTTPADGRVLHRAMPDSEAVELDAAHLACIERADEFNRAVRRFLSATR